MKKEMYKIFTLKKKKLNTKRKRKIAVQRCRNQWKKPAEKNNINKTCKNKKINLLVKYFF